MGPLRALFVPELGNQVFRRCLAAGDDVLRRGEGFPSRVHILGVQFDVATLETSAEDIMAAASAHEGSSVSTVNVAILMMMRRDRALASHVRTSRWVLADGQPIVWLSRLMGDAL